MITLKCTKLLRLCMTELCVKGHCRLTNSLHVILLRDVQSYKMTAALNIIKIHFIPTPQFSINITLKESIPLTVPEIKYFNVFKIIQILLCNVVQLFINPIPHCTTEETGTSVK